jgi:hypothetical protein
MIWPHKTSFNTRYVFIDRNVGGRVFILLGVPILTLYQLCRSDQLYWWRKPEYPEKSTDLTQVIDQY